MDTNSTPNDTHELPPLPGVPWVTMLTAFLILLVFGALVIAVNYFTRNMNENSPVMTGEQQLLELRAKQKDIVESYGIEPATKERPEIWHIPVERAMSVLIEQGKANAKGELESFPVKPKPKADKK
ncbi:MAG: hypothetical protein K8T89_23985 [Planctomycetes bacterium]|nr:hypothetical protein [Planctomycetota bacterium]